VSVGHPAAAKKIGRGGSRNVNRRDNKKRLVGLKTFYYMLAKKSTYYLFLKVNQGKL
jgi:hypothetical protein